MSSPRNRAPSTPEHRSENGIPRTPNRNTPRRQLNGNVRTPSSRNTTPSRRRIAGTSERDVVAGSEVGSNSQPQNAPSTSPFHPGM